MPHVASVSIAVLVSLILSASHPATGATYYVAPNGNDTNPGHESTPWRTLRKAADSVAPGDTVRIKSGEYSGRGFRFNRAGTAANPITYKAHGDGAVRITASVVVPPGGWTHVKDAIYRTEVTPPVSSVFWNGYPVLGRPHHNTPRIESPDDLIPNSYYLSGTTLYVRLEDESHPKDSEMRVADGHVVELDNCHYSIFEGLTVEYGWNGFKGQGTETHHVTYRNNTIRSIRSQGIQPSPDSAIIEGNLFQKIGVTKYEHGIYTCTPSGPTSGNRYYVDAIIWRGGGHSLYNNVFLGEGKRTAVSLNSTDNLVLNNTFVGSQPAVQLATGGPAIVS